MSTPQKPLKWYKKLATKKGRLDAKAFIVEGSRAINQLISSCPDEIVEILTIEKPLPAYSNYTVRSITESQFHYISQTRTPQGVMAIVRMPADISSDCLPDDTGDKVLLLEDIQDPGNVGTLIRTAAAFSFSGVIMTENCADPLSPKCVQATAGTVLSLWLRRTKNYIELVDTIKKGGYSLIATDLDGTEDSAVLSRQGKLVLALGNEAAGLSKAILDMADYRLRIPTIREKVESLNVAACGAICMYLSSQTIPGEDTGS